MNRVVTRHSALRRMIQRVSADFDRFVSGRVGSYPKLQIQISSTRLRISLGCFVNILFFCFFTNDEYLWEIAMNITFSIHVYTNHFYPHF